MIFKHYADIEVPLTSVPINQSDKGATHMIVKGIIPLDGTITGSLFEDDKLLTHRRVFTFANMPFHISNEEKAKLQTRPQKPEIESGELGEAL